MQIPFLSFDAPTAQIREECHQVLHAFLENKQYVLGPLTTRFEEEYAAFCGAAHCVGLSNGLDALQLSLRVAGIGAGDEVIVASNAYIAAHLAITHAGAVPVLVEPDPLTCNLDPHGIEAAVTPRTRAILPVHLYGQACEMVPIMRIAEKYGLTVIEDNAQAQGASCEGIMTGAWGHINATSFYPTKNLGALGEAGAITTQSAERAAAARTLRNYGSAVRYYTETEGFNWRIDELQAGFLSVKLRYLNAWIAEKQTLAARYLSQLAGIAELQLPVTAPGVTHSYHLFVVQTPRRDALQDFLKKAGIGTLIHYPVPPHLQKAYIGKLPYPSGSLPVAERLAASCLSLPLYNGMTFAQTDYICEKISEFFHG